MTKESLPEPSLSTSFWESKNHGSRESSQRTTRATPKSNTGE
jgi:hypothetical protein